MSHTACDHQQLEALNWKFPVEMSGTHWMPRSVFNFDSNIISFRPSYNCSEIVKMMNGNFWNATPVHSESEFQTALIQRLLFTKKFSLKTFQPHFALGSQKEAQPSEIANCKLQSVIRNASFAPSVPSKEWDRRIKIQVETFIFSNAGKEKGKGNKKTVVMIVNVALGKISRYTHQLIEGDLW